MAKNSDNYSFFIYFAKAITILAYIFFCAAFVFLTIGFILLLFGANPDAGFVKFIYHFAAVFLQPFRGIFPGHHLSERSYFSASALFAVIIYGLGALAIHSIITYLTLKQTQHSEELNSI